MYVPSSFGETDPEKLHTFIDQHSFATLISQAGNEPFATHVPLLLDRDRGPQGTLTGHMARANPHWQTADGQRVLVIFSGPHVYISPSWYESSDVVPTWNYVTVHVYGALRLIGNRGDLAALIHKLVERYESKQATPWQLDSQNDAFISRMLDAIVGFQIEIDRIEGKWKLSQNHPPERREKVIRQLRASNRPEAQQIADLMSSR